MEIRSRSRVSTGKWRVGPVFISPEPAKYIDREIDRKNVRRYLEESEIIDWMKILKSALLGLLVVTLVATLGFVVWAETPLKASPVALTALETNAQVKVTVGDGFIAFQPVNVDLSTGFIFYPGGHVDYRAYSPALRMIAEQGYFVALLEVNLNLAFFDVNAADRVITKYPAIQHWVVGGHSLGGIAAADYALQHLDALDGLIFWASYPANDSLKNKNIKILSIYGTLDMAGMSTFDEKRPLLPSETEFVVIQGGNHSQFGDYGFQSGDNEASISRVDQQRQVVDATVGFLESLSQ